MGKIKKTRLRLADESKSLQHKEGLPESILSAKELKNKGRKKEKFNIAQDDSGLVDEKLTKKILQSALSQQDDLEEKIELHQGETTVTLPILQSNSDSDDDNDECLLTQDHIPQSSQMKMKLEEVKIDEKDEQTLNTFMNPNPPKRQTLAEVIMARIKEKEEDVTSLMPDVEHVASKIDPRIRSVYRDLRIILQRYRSGKLPKAFKVIPHLRNWEEILYITDPDSWSAAAMYQATRVFTAAMNANMAQRFYYLVLLPRVRDDIQYYKRLNFHLFSALKKCLFKPAAFFKGILLPLCEEGTCTLREATIIGSVLAKFSVPVLHASAALLKIAEMKYSGANSIFLRILITKKYALPFRVIDAMVFHFLSFRTERKELPVLWHQSLLSFVEIYRGDVSSEQIEALLGLLRVHPHPSITAVIRKQLQTANCRDVEMDEPPIVED